MRKKDLEDYIKFIKSMIPSPNHADWQHWQDIIKKVESMLKELEDEQKEK